MKRGISAFATIVLTLTSVSHAQDVIKKKDGSTLPAPGGREISIKGESATAIKYKMKGIGAIQSFPAKDVAGITYSRQPEAYRMAEQAFADKDYNTAIGDYTEAINRGRGYHWVKQNALYKIAACQQNLGAYKEAIDSYRKLLKEVPDTRFLARAHLGIIQCLFFSKGGGAEKQIEREAKNFDKSISKHKLDKKWKYEAEYWKLRVKNVKGEDITSMAQSLSRDAATANPSVANKAKILIGLNLLRDPKKAKDYFENVLREAQDDQPGVKAAGYTGLGICIYKLADQKDTKSFSKAKDLFLRSIVLGDQHPTEVERDITVRALFHAARCLTILKKESKHNSRHARDLYREIIQDFKGTDWAKKADVELKKR